MGSTGNYNGRGGGELAQIADLAICKAVNEFDERKIVSQVVEEML